MLSLPKLIKQTYHKNLSELRRQKLRVSAVLKTGNLPDNVFLYSNEKPQNLENWYIYYTAIDDHKNPIHKTILRGMKNYHHIEASVPLTFGFALGLTVPGFCPKTGDVSLSFEMLARMIARYPKLERLQSICEVFRYRI